MESLKLDRTLGEIVATNPDAARVFERLGIDYCCGGQSTLADACRRAGLAPLRVAESLEAAQAANPDSVAWTKAPLHDLVGHIVNTHHAYIRREVPRLQTLLAKVIERHGENHPELRRIRTVFNDMWRELEMHLVKEENVLFPILERLEESAQGNESVPRLMGSVDSPIHRMRSEHQDAGEQLGSLRKLSNGYQLPPDACVAYGALYQGLEEFERDLHEHIHLENNILFPRGLELERAGMKPSNGNGNGHGRL